MRKIIGLLILISLFVIVPQQAEARIFMGKDSAIVCFTDISIDANLRECLKVMDLGFAPYGAPSYGSTGYVYIFFHRIKQ